MNGQHSPLVTPRSLVIIVLAVVAGVTTAGAQGWGAGIVAAVTVAGGLHALVARGSGKRR